MSFKRIFEKVRYIDFLISKKATGGQKELAGRVGLSVSTINVYLNEMKEAGFPIKYCNKRRTYYYDKEGKMVSSLFQETMDKEHLRNTTGGGFPFHPPQKDQPNYIPAANPASDYIGVATHRFAV